MTHIHDSVLSTVGHTPMVRLHAHQGWSNAEILIKLESTNPGGSIKDRTCIGMIRAAEDSGALQPGGTIIESSSGNTAKALALIGSVLGYSIIIVIDPKTPKSVQRYLTALGARIEKVDTPDADGGFQRPRRQRVQELVATTPRSFWPNQMENAVNPRTHEQTTAIELFDQAPNMDYVVATASTGGHLTGIARALRRLKPQVHVRAADAVGSAVFGDTFTPYRLRGLGLAWEPPNLDPTVLDSYHMVRDLEAIAVIRYLAKREGILLGESSGVAVLAALHLATYVEGTIVVVSADGGNNYLDETYDDDWLRERGLGEAVGSSAVLDEDGLHTLARYPSHSPVLLGPGPRV